MYLKVQYNNSIKQYTLTDSYNKPYIKVSNSILPLTTNTTQGLCIVVSTNNTTYRPLEYNSMSTSATYYTSAINSNGLSSTTALTRSSTSRTEYLTRSSTSSTVYDTRSSTSSTNYLTNSISNVMSGIQYASAYGKGVEPGQYNYSNSRNWTCQLQNITKVTTTNRMYTFEPSTILAIYGENAFYTYSSTNTIYRYASETRSGSYTQSSSTFLHKIPCANTTITRDYSTTITYRLTSQNDRITVFASSETYYTGYNCVEYILDFRSSIVSTTGTSYLTRSSTSNTRYLTRSSTYSTVYHTCSSTSGYSGVSSSSSQSSGWL